MSSILEIKRKAIRLGLCEEYHTAWDRCETQAELIKLATKTESAAFLCDAYAFGWANMSTRDIKRDFADYINGGYIVNQEGYTSEMYVGVNGKTITACTTLLLLLDCDCRVIVPNNHICRIFVAGGNVHIDSQGVCEVEEYYDPDADESKKGKLTYTGRVVITTHNKSEWKK